MKVFFDTSVLVPIFYGDHDHHAACLARLLGHANDDTFCGAHSLVEVYSTLTRMPGRYRATAEQAILFVRDLRDRLTAIALDDSEYGTALEQAAAERIVGGAVYDAILVRCAVKSDADIIYTWNVKHYVQSGPDVARRLQVP